MDKTLLICAGDPSGDLHAANLVRALKAQDPALRVVALGGRHLKEVADHFLFDLAYEQIEVVVHPTSIVHALVRFRDGAALAHLGYPDMRVPIAYALSFPERIESGAEPLDFLAKPTLTFEEADERRFPGLFLSWQALRAAEGATAVLNAANEEAVAAFVERRLRFDQIHRVNRQTLEELEPQAGECASVEGLLGLDGRARRHARHLIAGLAG